MIKSLHKFSLFGYLIFWLLFVNVAIEVVFMVWLPRLRTHIAEIFTTSTSHKVATHRTLNSLFTKRTYFGIIYNPLNVSLLHQNLRNPLGLLFTFTGVMIITLASETEHLSAHTLYCLQTKLVQFYAIVAVNSSAELIILICCYEQFTEFLLVFLQPICTLISFAAK